MKRITTDRYLNKSTSLRFLFGILISMTLLPSCLKSDMEMPVERKLQVAFSPNTLQITDIDSGAVIFQKQNSLTPYFYRFQKNADNLEINLEDITTGNWTANLILYSKKDNNNKSYQFNASLNFVAEHISGILLLAPSLTTNTSAWKKSNVISTPDNSIIAVLPTDATNGAFEIRVREAIWDEVSVERAVYRRNNVGNELLGEATWTCKTACFGSDRIIFNTQAFAVFAEANKNRPWNNADAVIVLKDSDQNLEKEFYFNWEKE